MNDRLTNITLALRIAIGLMATLAGLDKFFNLLADWHAYIAPVALQLSPLSPGALMGFVGLVEVGVGLTILAVSPTIGAYIAGVWLSLVAINLVIGGHLDVAVRDLVLAVAAFSLGSLSQLTAERRSEQSALNLESISSWATGAPTDVNLKSASQRR